jgi:hypothetical protein
MATGRTVANFAVGFGLALALAAPAAAGDPPNKTKYDPSKRICRVETPSGSRFTRRICKSAEEWQRDEEYSQTRVDENRQSLRSPDMPGAAHPQ